MRSQAEYNTCKAIAQYLRLQYPNVIFHFDLAGLNLSRAQAGMMKAIQGGRGWPDLTILHPKKRTVMFLEIKPEGMRVWKKDHSYTTPHIQEQAELMTKMYEQGFMTDFGIGIESCIDAIDNFLK